MFYTAFISAGIQSKYKCSKRPDIVCRRKYTIGKKSCDSGLFSDLLIMESCSVCSETGFISEPLCMKIFVVVADAEEFGSQIYGKGTLSKIALWRCVSYSRLRIWTIIMAHETKTIY